MQTSRIAKTQETRDRSARVLSAVAEDPAATSLLTALLRSSVLSSRASAVVHPVPAHPLFLNKYGEPDVLALRDALPFLHATLISMHRAVTLHQNFRASATTDDSISMIDPIGNTQADQNDNGVTKDNGNSNESIVDPDLRGLAMLEAAIFGNYILSSTPRTPSPKPRLYRYGVASFSHADLRGGRKAERYAVHCSDEIPEDEADAMGHITAFHGSAVENWYGIVNGGLREVGQTYTSNGRVYGDGVYLASDFATAASFSAFDADAGMGGMCIVGEFSIAPAGQAWTIAGTTQAGEVRVRRGIDESKPRSWGTGAQAGVPEGYWVIRNPERLRLRALHVLWGQANGANGMIDDGLTTHAQRRTPIARMDWVLVVVVLYLTVLYWAQL